ncbi:MAG TPA: TIGR03618 family F420-dependent PPOX class oxidoreductase [Acidimicrobiales bacterium]
MTARFGVDGRRLLEGINYAHLATLMADGSPKVEPVWVEMEGELILVATDAKSIKAVNVERDARVAMSITAFDDPYDQLLVRGRVVEIRPDDDLVVLDRMSQKYLGAPFPRRRWSKRLVLAVAADVARHYRSSLQHPQP